MNKQELLDKLIKDKSKKKLERLRLDYAKEHHHLLTNVELLELCDSEQKRKLAGLLKTKPVRSVSGIAVLAVMTRAKTCPGKCIYCPQGPGAAKSYTGLEPAARRAKMLKYDPYAQTVNRLASLKLAGNPTDKIELIIMGGTFTSKSRKIQEKFLKGCFDALNGKDSENLKEAQKLNETSKHRCTGLCYETRPDECTVEKIGLMREFGVTRVEIGVQSIYDDVLKKVNRGHGVKETIDATRRLKDAGLKVQYHIMPGLPGSDVKRDLNMFRELFSNQDFKPDMLKIYPCLVVENTELEEWWRSGKFKPLETDDAKELVTKASEFFPPWVRIMRIQRDIPVDKILAGVKKSNLGQLVAMELEAQGKECKCIRCREIGQLRLRGYKPDKFELRKSEYTASGGKEVFLSLEDSKSIAGFLRLRLSTEWTFEHLKGKALVRELRIFGEPLAVGKHDTNAYQHKGMGSRLMKEAEKIAKSKGMDIAVTSSVGTRDYYRKLGYKIESGYACKKL